MAASTAVATNSTPSNTPAIGQYRSCDDVPTTPMMKQREPAYSYLKSDRHLADRFVLAR